MMKKNDKILVVGSLAYDHVMSYDGRIRDAVIPGEYSMSFTASSRAVFFGGCAGNIAYSLKLMGENPLIMTVAGNDFASYEKWLERRQIDTSGIIKSERILTASAFILTDKEQKQLTIFDPGAMQSVIKQQSVNNLDFKNIKIAIIAPDEPQRMIKTAAECKRLKIPYIFDPGQQINVFKPDDLLSAMKGASIVIANEYETKLMAERLKLSSIILRKLAPVFIETRGSRGSFIREGEKEYLVKAVSPDHEIDPTGCGDAFRAGVLSGLVRGYNLEKCAKTGALLATYSIEEFGTQKHEFSLQSFKNRYRKSFGESL